MLENLTNVNVENTNEPTFSEEETLGEFTEITTTAKEETLEPLILLDPIERAKEEKHLKKMEEKFNKSIDDGILTYKIRKAMKSEKGKTEEGISIISLLETCHEKLTISKVHFASKIMRKEGLVPHKGKNGKRFWVES